MKKTAEIFDATLELEKIRRARISRPRSVRRKSKIDKYEEELFSLRDLGASGEEMRIFLQKYKGVTVSRPTIYRIFHPRTTSLATRMADKLNAKTRASNVRKK